MFTMGEFFRGIAPVAGLVAGMAVNDMTPAYGADTYKATGCLLLVDGEARQGCNTVTFAGGEICTNVLHRDGGRGMACVVTAGGRDGLFPVRGVRTYGANGVLTVPAAGECALTRGPAGNLWACTATQSDGLEVRFGALIPPQ